MASRKLVLGLTAARRLRPRVPVLVSSSPLLEASTSTSHAAAAATHAMQGSRVGPWGQFLSTRTLSSTRQVAQPAGDAPGPSSVDHRSILPEDEFHKLADETIHDLLEKLEEYGDSLQMDGFDIDYGNQVLTLRLGELGTYVVNKQTPNRQIWLSSPASGPSRFDWDASTNGWIYRRTGANLVQLLEKEIGELCGSPVELS
ncbi:frataxin, mitochondrial [Oryza brachyantha]|nr:frataxin, mitochondrial [Oryza brachyantha]